MICQVVSISAGTWVCALAGLRANANAPLGQVDTHNPQPMQRSVFRAIRSPSAARASIWHRPRHVQQPMQISDSSVAMNALAAIAAGADGLLIEAHQDPENALSDGQECITPETLKRLVEEVRRLEEVRTVEGVGLG